MSAPNEPVEQVEEESSAQAPREDGDPSRGPEGATKSAQVASDNVAETPKQAATESPRQTAASLRRAWTLPSALAISALFLAALSSKSGIWDPFELSVAELSRRIAVNAFGAKNLILEGADNSMPKIGELGRGELPFDSIALGFRLFGLHDWAGRLPLALWGLGGAAALYWLLAKLVSQRAGLYGALILSTMPLYFLHARTMLGDIVTMAAVSIACAGLGVAAFDRSGSARSRGLALGVGVLGMGVGFMTRGMLVGVALPGLGAGLTWIIARSSRRTKDHLIGDVAGMIALCAGVTALALGANALFKATTTEYSLLVGAQIVPQTKFPTFDAVIHYLGHALLPWSAFIPLAAGRLFRAPAGSTDEDDRASSARLFVLVTSAVAFGVYSLLAPRIGYIAFGAPSVLAAIAALAIVDFEEGGPPSPALAVGVVVFVALFLRDYTMFPEKGFSAFAVNAPTFPEAFKERAGTLVLVSSAIFGFIVFFTWLEEQNHAWFKLENYGAWPRIIVRVMGKKILALFLLIELGLVVVALVSYVGLHFTHSKWVLALGLRERLFGC